MQDVTIEGLDRLSKRLNALAKEFPESRRALHEQLAETLQREVRKWVSFQLNDAHGRIAGYQRRVVGSRGGYAAVRPISSSVGRNSPGAITNYLENGHKRRKPDGFSRRYRPRIHLVHVSGRHFYRITQGAAKTVLAYAAADLAEKYAKKLREPL